MYCFLPSDRQKAFSFIAYRKNKIKQKITASSLLVLIMVLGSILALFYQSWILAFGKFTFVPSLFLLGLLLSPWGHIRLGEKAEKLPLIQWFIKISAANLILMGLIAAGIVAFVGSGPSYIQPPVNVIDALKMFYLTQWGLFPWAIYGLWGVCLAYFSYHKNYPPFPHCCSNSLFQGFFEPELKAFIEGSVFLVNVLAITLSIAASVLLVIYSLEIYFSLFSYLIFPAITVLLLSFITPIFYFKFNAHSARRIARTLPLSLSRLLLGGWGIMVVTLLLGGLFSSWLLPQLPTQHQLGSSECEKMLGAFNKFNYKFSLFYWSWLLIWTPLAGSWLASISKGRSLRELVLGIFFMPLLIAVVGYAALPSDIVWEKISLGLNQPWVLLSLGIFNLITILMLTRNQFNSQLLMAGFMPLGDAYRGARTQLKYGAKLIGSTKFAHVILITLLTVVMMHTLGGWYILTIQFSLAGLLIIFFIYMSLLALVAQCKIDNKKKSPDES